MHETTNTIDKPTLKDWYENLPAKDQATKRELITSSCGVSSKTFYSWLNGVHIPKLAHQFVIKTVTKADIIFTNEASEMADKLPLVK